MKLLPLKPELGILADDKNNLSGYDIEIINDELVYRPTKKPCGIQTTKQEKLLTKKFSGYKNLISKSKPLLKIAYFGVDINPKSVLICRLRLWIELLKNAYYKETEYRTETLPNIDINIKCGNSLLSRFALDADLSKALKSIKYDIKAYRGFVNDYKTKKPGG